MEIPVWFFFVYKNILIFPYGIRKLSAKTCIAGKLSESSSLFAAAFQKGCDRMGHRDDVLMDTGFQYFAEI